MSLKIIEDFITGIKQCGTIDQSWAYFLKTINKLGFDSAMYILTFEGRKNNYSGIYLSNYNASFLNEYDKLLFATGDIHDVAVSWCLNNDDVIEWESDLFSSLQTKENKIFDDLAADYNMAHGLSIPIRSRSHIYNGGIGLCAENVSSKVFKNDIRYNIPIAYHFGNILHDHLNKLEQNFMLINGSRTNVTNLSILEIETLKWLVAGFTIKQISDEKMYKSIESINKYIHSAKIKLNVRTRDQLIARAMILGVI
jgi:DNA-binding CsgD family transcriptional regulator